MKSTDARKRFQFETSVAPTSAGNVICQPAQVTSPDAPKVGGNAAAAVDEDFRRAGFVVLPPGQRDLTLGKYFWNDAHPFTGLMADVRIYDRALEEADIFSAARVFLHMRDYRAGRGKSS